MIRAFLDTDWVGLGSDILSGIASGITNAVSGLVDAAIKACGRLVDSVKSFFGIASPSRLMAKEVGQYRLQWVTFHTHCKLIRFIVKPHVFIAYA